MSTHVLLRDVSFQPAGTGVPLISGCSLRFSRGLSLITGRSGCGKTTALSLIAGLAEPSIGHLSVGDIDVSTPASVRRSRVTLVFQFPERHFLGASVGDELSIGWPRGTAERSALLLQASILLRAVGLTHLSASTRLRDLSGGTQRRLALAIALMRTTPVLLLDEPLAGLDGPARRAVASLVAVVAQTRTIVVATHEDRSDWLEAQRVEMFAGGIRQLITSD